MAAGETDERKEGTARQGGQQDGSRGPGRARNASRFRRALARPRRRRAPPSPCSAASPPARVAAPPFGVGPPPHALSSTPPVGRRSRSLPRLPMQRGGGN